MRELISNRDGCENSVRKDMNQHGRKKLENLKSSDHHDIDFDGGNFLTIKRAQAGGEEWWIRACCSSCSIIMAD